MPALVIFSNFTTRPFAGDDLHIVCLVLGFYRVIQTICLGGLLIVEFIRHTRGYDISIGGIPLYCPQFESFNFTYNVLAEAYESAAIEKDFGTGSGYIALASIYTVADIAWIVMVWSAASIGTPTEPMRRDEYICTLVKVKMFGTSLFPVVLLTVGILSILHFRNNNYGCGNDVGNQFFAFKSSPYHVLFSVLLVTYALELLLLPMMMMNEIIRCLKKNHLFDRRKVDGRGGRASRFEFKFGLCLKCLQHLTRGKAGGADLKNQGELKEFATHGSFPLSTTSKPHELQHIHSSYYLRVPNKMNLMNNETKLDVVFSDMYVGLKMLGRVQAEQRVDAIKRLSDKSKILRNRLSKDLCETTEKRRSSIVVLGATDSGYKIGERELLLEANDEDRSTMRDAAHFVKYASSIYFKLRSTIVNDFMLGEEKSCFERPLDTLFQNDYRLTNIGLDNSLLCFASFGNSIVETPYAILIDEEVKKIVIVVRGTRSLEDLVIDLQFVPEDLTEVGEVCGFHGEGHHCHQGFLLRSKWMYNDIKRRHVLNMLYCPESPFQDYPLVICGHSLGAGCASILALMLRPAFSSLQCFAYEPPGCVFDVAMANFTEGFITSFVRNDDIVPRLSYHNFDVLRDEFYNILTRIKVPKIQLFFDLRIPSSDQFISQRNAKVLMPKSSVSRDTDFYKKLDQFRSERSEKNKVGATRVQLFLPGRVIHLVDTRGDNSAASYVPYYAQRSDFNQVIISKRMISDHDIHSMVDILNETRLCGDPNTISLAHANTPIIFLDDEKPDTDVRLFICCSNPWGKLPILLSVLASTAFLVSVWAHYDCRFFIASFSVKGSEGGFTISYGLYLYRSVECLRHDILCDNFHEYEEVGSCVPFPPILYRESRDLLTAQVFAFIVETTGFISLSLLMVSQCFNIKRRIWIAITSLSLVSSLFQGLLLLLLGSCDFIVDELQDRIEDCHIAQNAIGAIIACCLWFLCAAGSMRIVKTDIASNIQRRSSYQEN